MTLTSDLIPASVADDVRLQRGQDLRLQGLDRLGVSDPGVFFCYAKKSPHEHKGASTLGASRSFWTGWSIKMEKTCKLALTVDEEGQCAQAGKLGFVQLQGMQTPGEFQDACEPVTPQEVPDLVPVQNRAVAEHDLVRIWLQPGRSRNKWVLTLTLTLWEGAHSFLSPLESELTLYLNANRRTKSSRHEDWNKTSRSPGRSSFSTPGTRSQNLATASMEWQRTW